MPNCYLTSKFIASVDVPETGQVDYRDTHAATRGLALRVGSSGQKSWCLMYRMPRTRAKRRFQITKAVLRDLKIEAPLALKTARQAAVILRGRIQQGTDPAAMLEAWKQVETFGQFAEWYLKAAKAKKSIAEETRIINSELLPRWRGRKMHEIGRADVRRVLDTIVERGAPVMANRVLALVSRMFNLALEHDVKGVDASPAVRLKKPGGKETSRDRVLADTEVRRLWKVLDQAQHPPRDDADVDPEKIPPVSGMAALGLQLVLVTGQRPGECFGMRRADVSADGLWWTMPRTLTKNGNPHRVPLTDTAQAIIKAAIADGPEDNPYVFAGIAKASIAARSKKIGARLSAWKPLDVKFHRHDLRRTAASGMGAAGIGRDTIAHVLNHVDRGSRATAVYDRYSHDAEKRTALESWERRLLAIISAKDDADNVRPFQRRA